jgi:hypothetical protein
MKKEEKEMYKIIGILTAICLVGIFILEGNVTGFAIQETFLEEKFVLALDALIEAEANIFEVNKSGLNTFLLQDDLLEAKKYFLGKDFPALSKKVNNIQDVNRYDYAQVLLEDFTKRESSQRRDINYTKVKEISKGISERKSKALELKDSINLLKGEEEKSQKKYNTNDVVVLIMDAERALVEERYEEAEDLFGKAEESLGKASSEYLRLSRITGNFLTKYWWQSLIGIIILAYLIALGIKKGRVIRAKQKIVKDKLEIKTLKELMKRTQLKRFRKGKMSKSMYDIKMDKYRDKENKLKAEIPVLRNIVEGKKAGKKTDKKDKKDLKKGAALKIKR